jgi:hypothetical protein
MSPLPLRRLLIILLGGGALVWSTLSLGTSQTSDGLRDIEGHLLQYDTFKPASLTGLLDAAAAQGVSACDTHAQRALLLIEMPQAEAALRAGDSRQFDRHVQSLEQRARSHLACDARDSFTWLLLFNLALLHGQLDEKSLRLLTMSYATSPNEAWISIRRANIATPLAMLADPSLRDAVFLDFVQLVRNGYVEEAVRSYMLSPQPVRAALEIKLAGLENNQRQGFLETLQKQVRYPM